MKMIFMVNKKNGRAMFLRSLLLLAGVSSLLALSWVYALADDRIVAIVNNDVITLYELEKAFSPYEKMILEKVSGQDAQRATITREKRNFLDILIANKLVQQEAKRLGVSPKSEEVEGQIQTMMARQGISKEDFQKELAKDGLTLEKFKEPISKQIAQQRLVDIEIGSRITITDEEIGAFYADNRGYYDLGEAVQLQQIMLPFSAQMSAADKIALYGKMKDLVKMLKSGERFESVAAKYSQGPGSTDGGNIGAIGRGTLIPVLENVAFSLNVNDISDIIESPVGLHILRVTEKRAEKLPLQKVREEIASRIRNEKINEKLGEYIETLRGKANVEIKL